MTAEERAAIARQMKAEGATYKQIALALGLDEKNRGSVSYYLNLEARRRQQRINYLENVAAKRAYMRAYRAAEKDAVPRDRTAFRPETPRQSRMWAQLLAGAR